MKRLALVAGAGLLALGSVGAADALIAQYDNWIDRPSDSDLAVHGGVVPHRRPVINERADNPKPLGGKVF